MEVEGKVTWRTIQGIDRKTVGDGRGSEYEPIVNVGGDMVRKGGKVVILRQTTHLRFYHITCCIGRNIEHEFLVAQWDSLKVAWVLLKEALECLN